MRTAAIVLLILVVVVGLGQANAGSAAFFVVDETQAAVVTRFGEPRRSIRSPGIYVKTPFAESVTYFDKRRTLFDAPPDSLLTLDKKRLIIDVYTVARINDPLVFFQKVRSAEGAVAASVPIVGSGLREEIARDNQSEIIRFNREDIMNRVTRDSSPRLGEFGLDVVDVKIKRADFPDEIANSIYDRMRAERIRIASGFRAEGEEEALKIRADVDKQATIIAAEAERDADILRGEGEAEAIRIFADSLQKGPEFYAFQRSLQAYKKFLTQNTTVVLPADSELFQFLQSSVGINKQGR